MATTRRDDDDGSTSKDKQPRQAGGGGRVRRVGNYIVERRIGSGGQADVFLARDVVLRRLVALKVLHRSSGTQSVRGLDEARLIATLDHPNIVRVLHVELAEGVWYMAMEYVDGGNLELRISRLGPLDPIRALKHTQTIADALDHAHRIKVIHRDVKPQNLLETRTGVLKLADFGLAALRQQAENFEQTGKPMRLVGTPQYSPPEIWRGEQASHLCDIYSLGATLFFMVTGRPPFTGKTVRELRTAHLSQQVSIPNEVPIPVADIIVRTMAKDPRERPVSAKALHEDILDAIALMTGERRTTRVRRTVIQEANRVPGYSHGSRMQADTAVLQLPTLAQTREKLEHVLAAATPLTIFHGPSHVARIVRSVLDTTQRRFYTAARVSLSPTLAGSLASRMIEQLHLGTGPMPAWQDKVIAEMQPEAGTSPSLPSVMEIEARRPFTGAEINDLTELGRRAEGKSIIFLVTAHADIAKGLLQELEASSYAFLVNSVGLPELSLEETALFIRKWTGSAVGDKLRWSDDAIRYARHLELTKKRTLDQLMHNSIMVGVFAGKRVLTSWCVLGADAHPSYIQTANDIMPMWRAKPPAWPDDQMLATLTRLREESR
jgi:serine/threonine protein kinase